ncbi:MAG TPA: RagB/SusD family nutrient uptake outer membrane protein [Flavobacterium sp.]|uniref:RagB/SusD family nutrient uptake outer membrane protein n=1 Tax=Flavobacterium sp. TaxID=239 RepID=UPI002DBDEFE3|nr:RagB/SusD family nutrient uptake outer membrane protein [Flavobacterium sp.]HEU4791498.1 RagB/SusD family nutrient uptake outer membrane protein [Flavobacterium sp.]
MKIYKFLVLLFIVASCDLEREPYGLAGSFKTEADIKLALNAVYDPYYEEEGFGEGWLFFSAASDDMIVRSTGEDETKAVMNFATPTNNSWTNSDNWKYFYRSIRRANDVIKYTPDIDMSDSSRNKIMGEANFLAGFDYFFLAKRYGGLPFYDNTKPSEINPPRQTKLETYKRIEAYLLKSIEYFEKENLWKRSDEDWGRPNLGAAYGLLAKVYAHWGKFAECKAMAEKVINSGQYTLDVNNGNGFKDLFSIAGEKNNEVLFNLSNKPVDHQGTITSVVLLSGSLSGGTGWYYFGATKNLSDAFEAGDLRREVTVRGAGEELIVLGKPTVLTAADIDDMGTGFMGTKYYQPYEDLPTFYWEAGKDIPLLRYSDILLLHAEAIMQLAGAGPTNASAPVAAAAISFNKVRTRAGLAPIAAPTFTNLVHERRCELAYEDDRHFDLVRWGMAQSVYAAVTTASDPRGPRTFTPGKDEAFPIPQVEIDNSNGVLINNPSPGYSTF